jgi:hypothetical protein
MAINHIDIITTNRTMDERILPQILPSHLSIPLGLTLPEIYDESPIQIQHEENLLDETSTEINIIDAKKMDDLFQRIAIETSKTKDLPARKTRKSHHKK